MISADTNNYGLYTHTMFYLFQYQTLLVQRISSENVFERVEDELS